MTTDNHAKDAPWWVLVGPTASGKSAVALNLAGGHSVEIVSVDSMLVYRGMDVGTAKPAVEERQQVRHHMIDVLDPSEPCNVGWFCRRARETIRRIQARGNRPLLVGGTALYLKGLIWGLIDAPGRSPELRRRLELDLKESGAAALHRRLARMDPGSARRVHPNDVQRLLRAVEVCELTGEPVNYDGGRFDELPHMPHVMVGLRWERKELYRRIERRVDEMMAAGLLEEVTSLRGKLGLQARQALGYKELMDYLEGRHSLEEAVRLIKRNTRRFAKHQMTWFQHFPQVQWVDLTGHESWHCAVGRCEALLRRSA